MDKKKVIMLGGGAIAAGAFLYSQRGTEGALGTAGNIIAAPVEAFTGAPDTGVEGTKKDAGQQIVDILSMLPPLPAVPDTIMPPVPIAPDTGISTTTDTAPKKSFTTRSVGALAGTARVGATSVMLPTQILGGGVARATTAGIRYAMGAGYEERMVPAQRERVKKYPRASHAVSMVTGGITARAPVSKKQYAARAKYPRVYKAWKSMFRWVGA